MPENFDQPLSKRHRRWRTSVDSEATGVIAERIARFTGTPKFIIWLTIFVGLWLVWNSVAPERLRFDSAALGFTALTLMLSLQASYASPLILLAQNRQDERDRVSAERDRQHAMRTLSDTEFLIREIASLRMSMQELATRDFVRSEMRDQFELREQVTARDAELAAKDEKIAELEARLAQLETGEGQG